MPVMTLYRHGMTSHIPGKGNPNPPKRGDCGGWSKSSTRSNRNFLYSVDETALTGEGFAVSLTVRHCPPTERAWKMIRERFFQRLRDAGLIRSHWLTEWQRRMYPHMHSALWLPASEHSWIPVILRAWLEAAADFSPSASGQHIKPISDAVGWFKYLAKHAVRGLNHYQRSSEFIPEGWRKTGRMWGYLGDWPRSEPLKLEMGTRAWWKLRRLVRRYRIADARSYLGRSVQFSKFLLTSSESLQAMRRSGELRRLQSARGMLRCNDSKLSAVRGLAEWASQDLQLDMTAFLHASGHTIREVTP